MSDLETKGDMLHDSYTCEGFPAAVCTWQPPATWWEQHSPTELLGSWQYSLNFIFFLIPLLMELIYNPPPPPPQVKKKVTHDENETATIIYFYLLNTTFNQYKKLYYKLSWFGTTKIPAYKYSTLSSEAMIPNWIKTSCPVHRRKPCTLHPLIPPHPPSPSSF